MAVFISHTSVGSLMQKLKITKLQTFTFCRFTEKVCSSLLWILNILVDFFFPFFLVCFYFLFLPPTHPPIIIILIICRWRLRPNDQMGFLWEAECGRGLTGMQGRSCERFLLDEFREQRPPWSVISVGTKAGESLGLLSVPQHKSYSYWILPFAVVRF